MSSSTSACVTPLNDRDNRDTQVLAYVLWDWFDGGLFDFWK